jgi:hypothetical protein
LAFSVLLGGVHNLFCYNLYITIYIEKNFKNS